VWKKRAGRLAASYSLLMTQWSTRGVVIRGACKGKVSRGVPGLERDWWIEGGPFWGSAAEGLGSGRKDQTFGKRQLVIIQLGPFNDKGRLKKMALVQSRETQMAARVTRA